MSAIRIDAAFDLGTGTHTGHVRTENEDDYLVLALPGPRAGEPGLVLVAVADGMGGLAGGRDASRAAVRALATTVTARADDADGIAVLRAGFDAASARLAEIAASNPRLADLGTTLTCVLVRGAQAWIGHVGDSRCLRVRRGLVEQLSEDHALEEPRHLLTRCLGAGQLASDGDFAAIELRADDRFVLCTDGAWGVLSSEETAAELRGPDLQAGCERLVRAVLERGAPDNVTIVALRVDPDATGPPRDLDLPLGEVRPPLGPGSPGGLRPVVWPWLLIALAVVFAGLAWVRWRHGFDAWAEFRRFVRGG